MVNESLASYSTPYLPEKTWLALEPVWDRVRRALHHVGPLDVLSFHGRTDIRQSIANSFANANSKVEQRRHPQMVYQNKTHIL